MAIPFSFFQSTEWFDASTTVSKGPTMLNAHTFPSCAFVNGTPLLLALHHGMKWMECVLVLYDSQDKVGVRTYGVVTIVRRVKCWIPPRLRPPRPFNLFPTCLNAKNNHLCMCSTPKAGKRIAPKRWCKNIALSLIRGPSCQNYSTK